MFSKLKKLVFMFLLIFLQIKHSESIKCYGPVYRKPNTTFELLDCGPDVTLCETMYYQQYRFDERDNTTVTDFFSAWSQCYNATETAEIEENCCSYIEGPDAFGDYFLCGFGYEVCDTDGCNRLELVKEDWKKCVPKATCPPEYGRPSPKSVETDIAFQISPNKYLLSIILAFSRLLKELD